MQGLVRTLVASLLLGLGTYSIAWAGSLCAWLGLLVWLPVVVGASLATRLRWGAVFGVAFGMVATPWLPGALRAIGFSPEAATALWVFGCILFGGVRFSLIAIACVRVRSSATATVLLPAVTCGGVEWLLERLPGAVPWGLVGYSQADLGIAQLAALGGVPLVSGLVVATAVAVSEMATGVMQWGATRWAMFLGGGAVSMSCAVPLLGALASWEPGPAFLLVQPEFPLEERWSPNAQRTHLQEIAELTLQGLGGHGGGALQAVVWPETTLTTPLEDSPELGEDLSRWTRRIGVPVVAGVVQSPADGGAGAYRNAAIWVEPGGAILGSVAKTRPVPFGEDENLSRFRSRRPSRYMEKGLSDEPLRGRLSLDVVFCYEVLFPNLVESRRDTKTAAILNLANDGWFGSELVGRQQLVAARYRAIEQRLWLLRVAQGGGSAAVDLLGRVRQEAPWGRSKGIVVQATAFSTPRWIEHGTLAALFATGGALGLFLSNLLRRQPC